METKEELQKLNDEIVKKWMRAFNKGDVKKCKELLQQKMALNSVMNKLEASEYLK